MKLNRVSPLIVAVVGVVLSLLAAVGIYFLLIKPTQDATAVQQGIYDQNYPDSTLSAQNLAKKGLVAAKLKVQQIKFQWAVKSAAKMPRYDVSNRPLALRQITYELEHYLGPDLQRQLHLTKGVTTDTQIALPAPLVNPNDITAAPVVIPLGSITVNGDFRHILKHFYVWQYFNRLVVVDNLAFNGSSPYMQATYDATLYIFPQNDDKLGPTIPQAGDGTGGATSPGGAPGGFPGGAGGRGGFPGGAGGRGGFPGGAPGGFPGGAGGRGGFPGGGLRSGPSAGPPPGAGPSNIPSRA